MALRRRRQVNLKFYIFLSIIVVVAIVVLFFLFNINTAVVEQGTIPFEEQVTAVVVRDEQVVFAQNYGKANYIAAEGDRVEAETPVMEVYKWGYNEKVMNDLIDYQTKIEQYQENGLDDQKVTEFDTQIAQKAAEIKNIISGAAEGDVVVAERELNDLMAQKRQYLKETVPADQQLNAFYTQEESLQTRVNDWRQTLAASGAGAISYYLDGAEELLNASNIQNIKPADVLGVLEGTMKSQGNASGDETEEPVYRLVNDFKWYLLVHSSEEIPEFANDKEFSIAFDDYLAHQYQGKVVGNVKDETDHIYVIEILDNIGELLNVRRADAKVFTQFSGLKVPEKALVEENGVMGVNVVTGREKNFVPVTVDIIKDGNAIIRPVDENSLLVENQHVEV